MKENASGNQSPSSTAYSNVDDMPAGIPEGEELTIDPDSGELIDPVDRWWDDGERKKEEGPANRKLDPEDRKQAAKKAAEAAEEAVAEKEESEEAGPPVIAEKEDPPKDEEEVPVAEKQGPPSLPPFSPDASPEEDKSAAEVEEPPKQEEVPVVETKGEEGSEKSGPPVLPPVLPDLPGPEEAKAEKETGDDPEDGEEEEAVLETKAEGASAGKPPALPPVLPEATKPPESEVSENEEKGEESTVDSSKPEEVGDSSEKEDEDSPVPLFLFEDEEKKEKKKPENEADFLDLLDKEDEASKTDSPPPGLENESLETIELATEKESDPKSESESNKEEGKKPPVLPMLPVVEETEDNTLDDLLSGEKEKAPKLKVPDDEGADEEEKEEVPGEDSASEETKAEEKGDASKEVKPPVLKEPEGETEEKSESSSKDEAPEEALPAVAEEKAPRKKAGCWTMFTSFFFFASLLVFLLVAVAGFVAWTKIDGIRGDLEGRARTELANRGIYFDYETWKYEFPRGLVLENVKLYQTEKKEQMVVSASNFGLNVDFVGLARGAAQSKSGEVTFDDSAISLYQDGKLLTTLTEVDGEILASNEKVEFERFSTIINGLRVEVSGLLELGGEAKKPASQPEGEAKEAEQASSLAMDFSPLQKLAEIPAFEAEGDPPVLSVEFAASKSEGPTELRGTLNGTNFSWKGIPFTMVSAIGVYDPVLGVANVPNFQLGYGEGAIGGSFNVDTASKTLTIQRANSTVDLLALMSAWKPESAEDFSQFEFLDAPSIGMKGTLPFESTLENANLEFDYKHRLGMQIQMGERLLPLKDIRGTVVLNKGSLESNDFAADLLGGIVEINGATRLTVDSKPFSGLIEVSKLPLENLGTFFGKPDSGMSGDVYFNFRGVGYAEVEKIRGGGNLRIEQAELRSFPIIGQVQQLLGRVVPAFGLSGEGSVRGAYLIDSGMLLTNDLTVSQGGAQLVTSANLMLQTQEVDFTTTASLEEALAAATGMQGKSITVKGKGSLYEPEVTLEEFPKEFAADALSEVLGTSPKTLERLKEMMPDSEVIEEIGEALDEAVGEELGDEVRSILRAIPTPEE